MRKISKAITGAVLGFGAALGGVLLDGQLDMPAELLAAAGLGLVAGFGVYAAPKNEP